MAATLARKTAAATLAASLALGTTIAPLAAAEETHIARQEWSFDGVFGTFNRGALQRGFKVYKEVCSACHSMKLMSYRNLGEAGGPQFNEGEVKAIAASVEVTDGPNDEGDMFQRPGRPSDRFVSPFANDNVARVANGGALPPDLSVIAKAREGGADYIYAVLTGYEEAPEGFEVPPGLNYNTAFPGHKIAMAAPLADDVVSYDDNTPSKLPNLARDVSTFLMWASEPKLEARKRVGFQVMIYLIILAGLLFFTTRKIWTGIKH